MTLRACRGLGARRGAAAGARFARFLARDLNRRLGAFGRLLERDLEVVAEVGAPLHAAAPASAAEDVAEAEDIAETAEDVLEAGEDTRIESASGGSAEAGVAVAIVEVRLSGSARTEYASADSLNFSSAAWSPGFRSGWYLSASLR